MTKREAIKVILSDRKAYSKSLNYAVNYCRYALLMPEDSEQFSGQIPYILTNITKWRHPLAKMVREALRQ